MFPSTKIGATRANEDLWPPIPIIGPLLWANDDTIVFALGTEGTEVVVGRIT